MKKEPDKNDSMAEVKSIYQEFTESEDASIQNWIKQEQASVRMEVTMC